jgi:hypothetical protein
VENVTFRKISHYTKDGYQTLIHDNIDRVGDIISIAGNIGQHQSVVIKAIAENFMKQGRTGEYFLHPLHEEEVEGAWFDDNSLIIDEDVLVSNKLNKNCHSISMTECYNSKQIAKAKSDIVKLTDNIEKVIATTIVHLQGAFSYIDERDRLLESFVKTEELNNQLNEIVRKIRLKLFDQNQQEVMLTKYFSKFHDNNDFDQQSFPASNHIIQGPFPRTIIETLKQKLISEKVSLSEYICPFAPHKTFHLHLPNHNTSIISTWYPLQIQGNSQELLAFDFDSAYQKEMKTTATQKMLHELETSAAIKMTLANNYMKEAQTMYSQIRKIYNQALNESRLNDVIHVATKKLGIT